MTGARKLALCAGAAAVLAVSAVHHMPRAWAATEPQPGHGGAHAQPSGHPGQGARNTTPRQTAPTAGHGTAASGHGTATGGHGSTQPGSAAGHAAGHADGHADGHSTGHSTGQAADSHDGAHATDSHDAGHAATAHAGTADAHAAGHGDGHGDTHGEAHGASDALVPTYFGQTPDADTALAVLRDGNARWVSGHTQNPRTDESTRRDTAQNGQHPFATILTCADSRIPVERVFDRGVGELFVVRVAGNIVAETEAGTMEYGVEHLHTPVIVVMGHTGCGAVKAACEGVDAGGNVRFLLGEIEPAVRRAATMHPSMEGVELLEASVRENVMQSMFDLLATSESIRTSVDNGTVTLVGAVYNIETGEVEWIGEHPWQDGLISVLHDRLGLPGRNTATAGVDAETTGGRDGH